MARLTAAQRRALPASAFAGPNRSFPVNDKNHAKAALGLIGNAPPSARAKIRAAAHKKLGKPKSHARGGKAMIGTPPPMGMLGPPPPQVGPMGVAAPPMMPPPSPPPAPSKRKPKSMAKGGKAAVGPLTARMKATMNPAMLRRRGRR